MLAQLYQWMDLRANIPRFRCLNAAKSRYLRNLERIYVHGVVTCNFFTISFCAPDDDILMTLRANSDDVMDRIATKISRDRMAFIQSATISEQCCHKPSHPAPTYVPRPLGKWSPTTLVANLDAAASKRVWCRGLASFWVARAWNGTVMNMYGSWCDDKPVLIDNFN